MSNKALNSKDSYKIDHISQYPKGITEVYSNLTARSPAHQNVPVNGVIFVGMSIFIQDYLVREWNQTFFYRNKDEVILSYARRVKGILGVDIDYKHIAALHDLGYLPIEIKALPEGSYVPYRVPMMTIRNTHPDFAWVTNMLECVISNELWSMTTSATTYFAFKKLFGRYAEETGSPKSFIPYQGHDFSYRGMFGREAAAKSGLAVLLAGCIGTDNMSAIDLAEEFYFAGESRNPVGQSLPATEHSVICANGKETELDTLRGLLTETYPSGNLSYVSDTWDFWKVVTEFLPQLKDVINDREGKLVIRPDSGNPVEIICGTRNPTLNSVIDEWEFVNGCRDGEYFEYEGNVYVVNGMNDYEEGYGSSGRWQMNINSYKNLIESGFTRVCNEEKCKQVGLIETLWDIFGGTINQAGYKVLSPKVGAIYGDGINYAVANKILFNLKAKGFASCNIVFGLGSYLFQHVTRDTHGFAIKSTAIKIDGKLETIFKDPKTDDGTKKSAKGYLMVSSSNGRYTLVEGVTPIQERHGCLETVFKDGKILALPTIDEVRATVTDALKRNLEF